MKDQLITHETAKKADEKGFNWECENYYDSGFFGIPFSGNIDIDGYNHDSYSRCPTQSQLQKWIREEHNYHIYVNYLDDAYGWDFTLLYIETNEEFMKSEGFETYEDALENGLQELLSII